jgi:hypothetical protein
MDRSIKIVRQLEAALETFHLMFNELNEKEKKNTK